MSESNAVQTLGQIIPKSVHVLRKHPQLALPVLSADLLSFTAMHVQHALHQPLFNLVFGDKASVLSTTRSAFVLTPENLSKAFLLTAPLIWGCYFLSVCLYTTALLVTSALLDQIERNQKPDLQAAVAQIWEKKKRLFLFSLLMIAAISVAMSLSGVLMWGSMYIPWLARKMGRDFGYFVAFPLELAVVLLFTRPALNILRELKIPLAQGLTRAAALLGICVIAAQLAFLLLLEHAAPAILFQQTTMAGALIRDAIESLVGASPYIVLFIGLSLLAASNRLIANHAEAINELPPMSSPPELSGTSEPNGRA